MKSKLSMTAAMGVALAVSGAATLSPATASAQNTPALRLYDQGGFAGQSVRLTQSTTDLSQMRFGDKARSLVAEGRWEVCFDAGYAGNCRVVQGQVSDMGEWAARISSARYLGPSDWGSAGSGEGQPAGPAATPAGAPTTAPAAEAVQAFVYSTVGFDRIQPELVLNTLSGAVSGAYTATQSEAELDRIYREGRYGITSGVLEGQMSGSTLTGYWYERATNAGLQTSCETERNGTFVHGRFTLTFNADRTAFTGLRTACDITPNPVDHEYETWNGRLIRRQAATSPDASGRAASGVRGSAPSGPVDAQNRPLPGVVDRTARAAGDEVERRVQDRLREGIGRLF